jgi:DNA-binding CsgD family transcriptional regulator/tetratricopeptide (TPR) repeat protein
VQWADRPSVQALGFVLRRLSVDPVLSVIMVRGDRDRLDEPARRLLTAVERRAHIRLSGLSVEEISPLADALGVRSVRGDVAQRLHDHTGGHVLYLRTLLTEGAPHDGSGRFAVPPSLAEAIGEQLALLPAPTRAVLEILAVVDRPLPLGRLGEVAGVDSPSEAVEAALAAGLVDWWPNEPSCPVALRHALQRDAIYAGLTPTRRRSLHSRALAVVDVTSAWAHRVAALDGPDDDLAEQLAAAAASEAALARLPLAATHLLWAADISSTREGHEQRLLTAATYLMLADEARGLSLQDAVEACQPSSLRGCVLGSMALDSGRLGQAETLLLEALEAVRGDDENTPLAAVITNRLAGVYCLLGRGKDAMEAGGWALDTGTLDPAAASQTRTLVAIGASQAFGAQAALNELHWLEPDPGRVRPVDLDAISFRGVFHLLAGDLDEAIRDLSVSIRLVREGATFTLGLRAYLYLALAQYLRGAWDDVLLTAEQALSEATIHSRRYELPLLHLAATCVAAGRGTSEEAEQHAAVAEAAAAELPYGQERLYASMARALVCQAAGDHRGMVDALAPWHDNPDLDGRARFYGVLWRPLLVEGLIGAGRIDDATRALEQLQVQAAEVAYLCPALSWLEGWLEEHRGSLDSARICYERDEATSEQVCPVYAARLALAHGRLLRRTGNRRAAVERLRRAHDLFVGFGAVPFVQQVENELAACGLHRGARRGPSTLQMTSREAEVAHLAARGLTNAEIAAELFVTPKAVDYHLSNIYAKHGLKGRRQLRQLLAHSAGPAAGGAADDVN